MEAPSPAMKKGKGAREGKYGASDRQDSRRSERKGERGHAGVGTEVKPRLGHGTELGYAVRSRHAHGVGRKLGRCGATRS